MMKQETAIPVTDTRGRVVADIDQPEPGSVMLSDGVHGTAWQRHFSDGLWHPSRIGEPLAWRDLLASKRNLLLVYNAPERD